MSSFNTISAHLISLFHLNKTQFGAFSSIYLYANALWLLPAGLLLDKYSARLLTLFFMCLCVTTSFVFIFSSSILLDLLMRFIAGLGSAMSLLITLRFSVRWFPNRSAQIIGLLVALGMSGGIVANTPLLYLISKTTWKTALLYSAYLGIAIIIFMYFFLYDKKIIGNNSTPTFEKLYGDFKKVITHIQNWKIGIYIGLMNLPIFILASLWGDWYLKKTTGFSNNAISSIISMIFIGEIIGAPIMGWISDQVRQRKCIMIAGAIFSFAICVALSDVELFSAAILFCLYFFLGFFLSAQVVGYSAIVESNTTCVSSTASGFGSSIVNLLGAFGQIIFPMLFSFYLLHGFAHIYNTSFLLFPLSFGAAILLALFIKETANT